MFSVKNNLEEMRVQGESLESFRNLSPQKMILRESSPSHFRKGSNFSLTASLRALAASVSLSMLKPSLETFWTFFLSNSGCWSVSLETMGGRSSESTLDKAEINGHHVLGVISDENPPVRQLDVLSCLSILVEQFRRLAVGNEEERREGHLSLGD